MWSEAHYGLLSILLDTLLIRTCRGWMFARRERARTLYIVSRTDCDWADHYLLLSAAAPNYEEFSLFSTHIRLLLQHRESVPQSRVGWMRKKCGNVVSMLSPENATLPDTNFTHRFYHHRFFFTECLWYVMYLLQFFRLCTTIIDWPQSPEEIIYKKKIMRYSIILRNSLVGNYDIWLYT